MGAERFADYSEAISDMSRSSLRASNTILSFWSDEYCFLGIGHAPFSSKNTSTLVSLILPNRVSNFGSIIDGSCWINEEELNRIQKRASCIFPDSSNCKLTLKDAKGRLLFSNLVC